MFGFSPYIILNISFVFIGAPGLRLVVLSIKQMMLYSVAVASNLLPLFGKIIDIFIIDVFQCYFVFELLVTECFNSHYHASEVKKQTQQPTQLVVCKQSDLIDHHVLGLYHVSNLNLVSLNYYLLENI